MKSIENLVSLYNEGLSLQNIADKVGWSSAHSVRNMFLKHNIPIRTKAGSKNSKLDHDFFTYLDTEDSAYFAGFLLADGSISIRDKSNPSIRMELSRSDKYILEMFRELVRLDNPVRNSAKNCAIISLHSQRLVDDLAKCSVIPNKTGKKHLMLSNIAPECVHHFIRGFFDGNGHISLKGSRLTLGFSDGEEFLNELKDYMSGTLGISNLSVYTSTSYSSKFIEWGAQDQVNKLINYMYKDATLYLMRKYEKAAQRIC